MCHGMSPEWNLLRKVLKVKNFYLFLSSFSSRLVVEILLSSGMDVNLKTSGGTALHEAALCGKLDVVRTLLDAGVDLRLKDAKQNTVLDLLRQFPKHVTQDILTIIKS